MTGYKPLFPEVLAWTGRRTAALHAERKELATDWRL